MIESCRLVLNGRYNNYLITKLITYFWKVDFM